MLNFLRKRELNNSVTFSHLLNHDHESSGPWMHYIIVRFQTLKIHRMQLTLFQSYIMNVDVYLLLTKSQITGYRFGTFIGSFGEEKNLKDKKL